jgi:hypothetical protein
LWQKRGRLLAFWNCHRLCIRIFGWKLNKPWLNLPPFDLIFWEMACCFSCQRLIVLLWFLNFNFKVYGSPLGLQIPTKPRFFMKMAKKEFSRFARLAIAFPAKSTLDLSFLRFFRFLRAGAFQKQPILATIASFYSKSISLWMCFWKPGLKW